MAKPMVWVIASTLLVTAAAMMAEPARAQTALSAACEPLASEIEALQQRGVAATRLLGGYEHCIWEDLSLGTPSSYCSAVKQRASADMRKAWGDAVLAWNQLDRLRLELRGLEDRLGIDCSR
jgi:hypothetical protein